MKKVFKKPTPAIAIILHAWLIGCGAAESTSSSETYFDDTLQYGLTTVSTEEVASEDGSDSFTETTETDSALKEFDSASSNTDIPPVQHSTVPSAPPPMAPIELPPPGIVKMNFHPKSKMKYTTNCQWKGWIDSTENPLTGYPLLGENASLSHELNIYEVSGTLTFSADAPDMMELQMKFPIVATVLLESRNNPIFKCKQTIRVNASAQLLPKYSVGATYHGTRTCNLTLPDYSDFRRVNEAALNEVVVACSALRVDSNIMDYPFGKFDGIIVTNEQFFTAPRLSADYFRLPSIAYANAVRTKTVREEWGKDKWLQVDAEIPPMRVRGWVKMNELEMPVGGLGLGGALPNSLTPTHDTTDRIQVFLYPTASASPVFLGEIPPNTPILVGSAQAEYIPIRLPNMTIEKGAFWIHQDSRSKLKSR